MREAWSLVHLSKAGPQQAREGRSMLWLLCTQGTCWRPGKKVKEDEAVGGRAACGRTLGSATDAGTCHRPVTPELDTERTGTASTAAHEQGVGGRSL